MGFAPTTCPTAVNLEKLFYPSPATIATAANELVGRRAGWIPMPLALIAPRRPLSAGRFDFAVTFL